MHVIYTICAMPFSYLYNGKNNKKNSPVSIFRVIAETSSKIHLSSLAIKLFFSNNSQYYEYHVINLFFLFLMFTVIHNGLFLVNDMHTVLRLLKSCHWTDLGKTSSHYIIQKFLIRLSELLLYVNNFLLMIL